MADWQVGDLALCVDDGPQRVINGMMEAPYPYVENLRRGQIYAVTHVVVGRTTGAVGIADWDREAGGCEDRFRKITPGADIEGIDVERRVPTREDA